MGKNQDGYQNIRLETLNSEMLKNVEIPSKLIKFEVKYRFWTYLSEYEKYIWTSFYTHIHMF